MLNTELKGQDNMSVVSKTFILKGAKTLHCKMDIKLNYYVDQTITVAFNPVFYIIEGCLLSTKELDKERISCEIAPQKISILPKGICSMDALYAQNELINVSGKRILTFKLSRENRVQQEVGFEIEITLSLANNSITDKVNVSLEIPAYDPILTAKSGLYLVGDNARLKNQENISHEVGSIIIKADTLSSDSIKALFNKVKEYLVVTMSTYQSLIEIERNINNVPVNQLQINKDVQVITLIKERFDKIMEQVTIMEKSQFKDSSQFMEYYFETIATIDRLSVTRPGPAPPPQPAKAEAKSNNWILIAGIAGIALLIIVGAMFLLLKWQKKRNMLKLQQDLKRKLDLEIQKQLFQVRHNQNRLKI